MPGSGSETMKQSGSNNLQSDRASQTGPPRPTEMPRAWMWETDLQGRVTWCSPDIEPAYGISPAALTGKPLDHLGLTGDSSAALARALESGDEIRGLILEAQASNGDAVSLWLGAVPRLDTSGLRAGYRGVIRVLERRRQAPTGTKEEGEQKSPIAATTPPGGHGLIPVQALTGAPLPRPIGYRADATSVQPVESLTTFAPDDSRLVIPILDQERLLGVLEFGPREDGRAWSEDDRLLAEAAAQQVALALTDARSYQLTRQALEEMREADRLKTQFLANMSHELRTPLNSIIGFSRVILKGIDGPINETQAQDLTAIYNAGQHLLGLINDILDLSRIEAGKMELAFGEVDLLEVIRSVMSTAAGLVKDKPIELVLDLPEHLPLVQADSIRVRQVLLNLISNATKFTERGRVGVTARLEQSNGRREVVVSVFDTGPGIPPEHLAKLFEPFSQVDASPTRKTGGTGLGLSICRHLVELHGGRIWVESRVGEGSTFSFSLPLQQPQGASFETTPSPNVILIDDDPGVIDVYRQHWADPHHWLHSVVRPQEAVSAVRQIRPRAIVLNPLLPTSAAWQVMASLRASSETRYIPVLLASLQRDHAQGACFGPVEWLTPPLRPDDLLAAILRLSPRGNAGRKVLAIAEAANARQELQAMLGNRNEVQLVLASTVPASLEAAAAEPPDVVVIDLTGPSARGFDILEAIQQGQHTRGAPLVLLAPLAFTPEQQADLLHRWAVLQEQLAVSPAEVAAAVQGWLARLGGHNAPSR